LNRGRLAFKKEVSGYSNRCPSDDHRAGETERSNTGASSSKRQLEEPEDCGQVRETRTVAQHTGASGTRRAPPARIEALASAGVEPHRMGMGLVPATRKVLAQTGLSLDDLDLIELNETFAAQVLAVERELDWDVSRRNVHGGAVALGHPTGCTGTRIVVTLLYAMRQRDTEWGLATLCVGGGLGMFLLVQR